MPRAAEARLPWSRVIGVLCRFVLASLCSLCLSHRHTSPGHLDVHGDNYPTLYRTQLPPPCSPIMSEPIAAAGRSPRHSSHFPRHSCRRACCCVMGHYLNQCQPSLQLCTQPSAGNYPVSNSPRTPRHHEEAEMYRQERLDRMVRAKHSLMYDNVTEGA